MIQQMCPVEPLKMTNVSIVLLHVKTLVDLSQAISFSIYFLKCIYNTGKSSKFWQFKEKLFQQLLD